jgi:homoserine dehydrogenase
VTSERGRPNVVRVGLLGAGTVGRQVVRAFLERPEALAIDGGPRLVLNAVAVRYVDRATNRGIDPGILTDAPAHLVASPETDVIVELMGGDEPARTLIAAALEAGKAVVTANKHVLAHHGPGLEEIARRRAAPLRFEAAVGGGIPVLGPLAAELASNRVTHVRGIVNGTTNAILSAMADLTRAGGPIGYDRALADAQAAGFAEADPTADMTGADAANKLSILSRLAFGTWLEPDSIDTRPPAVGAAHETPRGITTVDARLIAGAAALDLAVRLVADARQASSGGPITASVLPTAVPRADPLGRVTGVTNRIEIRAEPLGSVAFTGPGAGGPATASAVLADLRAIALDAGSTWAGLAPGGSARAVRVDDDTAAADRGWLAVLPGRFDGTRVAAADVVTVVVGETTAIHAAGRSRGSMRELLTGLGADPQTVFLPVDERMPPR